MALTAKTLIACGVPADVARANLPHMARAMRAHGLDRIEQKMTAIEQGNRKQVQQPNRNREHGGKVDQRSKPDGGDLT